MSNSEYSEFHKNFKKKMEELNNIGSEINKLIDTYSKKIDNKENTSQIEIDIQKKIDEYIKFQKKFDEAYDSKNLPPGIPKPQVDKRQREISGCANEYKNFQDRFSALQSRKYEFKTDKLEQIDYNEKYKGVKTNQLLMVRDNNIKEQNKHIEDISTNVKKGTTLAKNINAELENQNTKLEFLNEDIDKLDSGMKRTMKKFETYIQETSICRYLLLIFILVAIFVVEYFLFA
jgi:chromosome segregation ATPase